MNSLSDLLTKAAAYTRKRHDLVHPCAQTCSGHWQGVDEGAYGMHARLTPLLEAYRAVAVAAEEERVAQAKYNAIVFGGDELTLEQENEAQKTHVDVSEANERLCSALDALRKVCGE